jgi:hypothetical protein
MYFVSLIGIALSLLTKYFITKALLALGLGFVTYAGINQIHEWFEAEFILAYTSMPSDLYAIATIAGVDDAIKIILTSVATAWSIRTVGGAATAMLKFTGVGS